MQAAVTLNHEIVYVCHTGQGEAQRRTYKKLNFGGGQTYDGSVV